MRFVLTLLTASFIALPLAAQNAKVVGTAIVDGQRVELLSDRSWRYAEAATTERGCAEINHVLQLCGVSDRWTSLDTTGTEFIRQFRLNSRTYSGIIYEELGAADGLTAEFMRQAVLENAAMFTGVRAEDIPVISIDTLTVDENPAERVVYGAKFNGLDIVYQNTIVNAANHNIQVVVWSVGAELTDEAQNANADFINAIRIDFPRN